MNRPDDPDLPAPRAPDPPAPARNLTTQELEAVIRRAVELQAGSSARTEDGISEGEVVRIGQELGLDPATVRRAIAETRGLPVEESGALATVMGPGTVRATRVLRRPAAATAALLERYLRETELMVPQRRFAERTRYLRDSSLAAGFARLARGLSRTGQPLNLKQVDVAVSPLEQGSCLVELNVDLAGARAGHAAGAFGGGGALATGLAVAVWATPVAEPFMLLGIPILGGAWYGMRAIYGAVRRSTQDKLESLLDRLEHDELE